MGKWNAAKFKTVLVTILTLMSFQYSYAQLSEVPVLEGEDTYEQEYEGELEGHELEATDGVLVESEGGTFLEEPEYKTGKLQSIVGEETKYEDPFSGQKITANQYKKTVDTGINADVSWTLQDKNKIDEDNVFFKGQDFSLVDWENLDPIRWLDFDTWRANRAFRDENQDWKLKLRERSRDELVGKVISCVGSCKIFRGKQFSQAHYLSRIKEGDEVMTDEDSYMWIYLMDGTLVRVSPHTSISFNEFNISNKKFFHYARLNKGHILWYSRIAGRYKHSKLHETDTIFLPLKLKEANIENFKRLKYQSMTQEQKDIDVYSPLNANKEQVEFLNKKIESNYKLGYKDSEVLLVLPNCTINAENAVLDVFAESGNDTYIRSRDIRFQFDGENTFDPKTFLFFRGYNNKKSRTLDIGQWYSVSMEGRDYKEVEIINKDIYWSEFITKRIPTILLAREIFVEKFSKLLMNKSNIYEDFAFMTGYRLWAAKRENDDVDRTYELNQRKGFLIEYTRRVETTNLRSLFKLLDKLDAEGKLVIDGFGDKYYGKAFRDYFHTISNLFSEDDDVVKEYKEAQYYIWNLTNSKGR